MDEKNACASVEKRGSVCSAGWALGWWLALVAFEVTASASELGTPLLKTFTPADYGGHAQTGPFVQDDRGVMYVGNFGGGILEYDGVKWRRIPVGDAVLALSLAVAADGAVYVGIQGDFGYLKSDATGERHYTSFRERLPAEERRFGDVFGTFARPEGVYYITAKRIFRLSPHTVRIWRTDSEFQAAQVVRGSLYVNEMGRGLLVMAGDELKPLPNGEKFAHEPINAMLPYPPAPGASSTGVLIGTRHLGWYTLDDLSIQPWISEADAAIRNAGLSDAVWLSEGQLAVATGLQGVFILDAGGRFITKIDTTSGLPDQVTRSVFEDREGGLWLGLDGGGARVNWREPFTQFSAAQGLRGSVIDMYRYRGTLYVGTTQGLYRLVNSPLQAARFLPVPEARGQCWAFVDMGDALLAAGSFGVLELQDKGARLLDTGDIAVYALARSTGDRNRVFAGTHHGVLALHRDHQIWRDEGAIAGLSIDAAGLLQESQGALWVGSLNEGVAQVLFDSPQGSTTPPRVVHIERFGAEQGLPKGFNLVYSLGGGAVFGTMAGIERFDERAHRFLSDARFANVLPKAAPLPIPIHEDARGRVWTYLTDSTRTLRESGAASPDRSGAYHWRALPALSGHTIFGISSDSDGIVWFGGEEGLWRYDSSHDGPSQVRFAALIRSVMERDGQTLANGARPSAMPQLPFKQNALRFEFAAPSFGEHPMQFQVRLDGVDTDWSAWSSESYRDYTNLHEGHYRFHVRPRNDRDTLGGEAVYEFRVLPPWYRTWLAYVSYAILTCAAFAGIAWLRSAALRTRNEELARTVEARTAQLSAANAALADLSVTDALTGLKNRRYLTQHVERELAFIQRARLERVSIPGSQSGPFLLFLIVDVDNFKSVNDRHGHEAGDRVLVQFARILQQVCRQTDVAVRWGGEEFVLCARTEDLDTAAILAERIREAAASHVFALEGGKTLRRTCSIGFAALPVFAAAPDRCSWEDAVALADHCLYRAKNSGRNTWVGILTADASTMPPELDHGIDLESWLDKDYIHLVLPTNTPGHRVSA